MIDKSLYKEWFVDFPLWLCGTCEVGHLVCPDGSIQNLLEAERDTNALEYVHAEDWTFRFAAKLVCNNPNCRDASMLVAEMSPSLELDHSEPNGYSWVSRYRPISIAPAPSVFKVPEGCPEQVQVQLEKAFELLWPDPPAAANRARTAIEALLDAKKVRKRCTNKNGKHHYYELNTRIEMFKPNNPEAAELLMAVKWIGNNGSHARKRELTRLEVVEGLEFLRRAIDLLFDTSASQVVKRAKKVISRKGRPEPPKKKRRKRRVR